LEIGLPQPNESSLAAQSVALPHVSGVYLFKGEGDAVLYVGKALDLNKRVRSYFRNIQPGDMKTQAMLKKVTGFDYVVTQNEKEALLLEASLIKKHRPRYNVILRDDKNYPALRIDPREPWPRLEIVRRFRKDGALYFGPYPSAHSVRQTLKLLNEIFPLRLCKSKTLHPRQRPCLNFALGRCLGACAGKVTQEAYGKAVEEVVLFLRGKTDMLQQQLRRCMQEAAAAQEYEQAAFCRDRLRAIRTTLEKQHIISSHFVDQDVLGVDHDEAGTELTILFIRQGVLIGQRSFDLQEARGDRTELLSSFIQQFYSRDRYLPDEILLPESPAEQALLEEWLSELKGRRVRIWAAQRGDRKHLLDLARENAREQLRNRRRLGEDSQGTLLGLQQVLQLPTIPKRIAGVDVSNLQGRFAVGSIVSFTDGKPDKSGYRRYRIQGVAQPDDPAMMAEAVERFLSEETALVEQLDLLVLDGGKGQLNRIHHLLQQDPQACRVPVIALAKETDADVGRDGRGAYDKVYLPGRKNPLFLTRRPNVLHLLQRLRDEAHRFAIAYYKKRHVTRTLTSHLDEIPGVGPRRRQQLINHFGDLDAIRAASPADLQAAPGISAQLAQAIYAHLHGPG
jgi:excinuclease ABC subunit C